MFRRLPADFTTAGKMNYEPGTNIAEEIDRYVLGALRDGVIWTDDTWSFTASYHYTWILSSLNFIVTVCSGSFAGHILRLQKEPIQRLKILLITGTALVITALLMDPIFPIIKHIWSSSMTLFLWWCLLLAYGYLFII